MRKTSKRGGPAKRRANARKQNASHLTVKGQITVPKAYRDALRWTTLTKLTLTCDGDRVTIVATADAKDPGQDLVDRWTGKGNGRFTTDEIMAMTRGEN